VFGLEMRETSREDLLAELQAQELNSQAHLARAQAVAIVS
jgi:hypothetical protein